LGLIRFGLAFAAVTPATFLMGMTLPLRNLKAQMRP
jgi:hypothetical protein